MNIVVYANSAYITSCVKVLDPLGIEAIASNIHFNLCLLHRFPGFAFLMLNTFRCVHVSPTKVRI